MAGQAPGLGQPPTYPQDWLAWAYSVLNKIGAQPTINNLRSLWLWTLFEKPPGQPTQWNNPLNTTQDYPGGVSVNSVGVKQYPDLQAGADATAQTITNGRYPHIIQSLISDLPATNWPSQAADELRVWGTKGFANQIRAGRTGNFQSPAFPSLPNPLGGVNDIVIGGLLVAVGGLLVIVGLAILALAAFRASGAAGVVSSLPGVGGAVGKVASAGRSARPKAPARVESASPAGQEEERAALRAEMAAGNPRPAPGAANRARSARMRKAS